MRALRVVAIASIVCLACSDSTGLTLEGSPFMRARIDGRPFSLQESDVLSWGWGGTLGGFLSVQGLPATLAPDSNEFIYIQVGAYNGPGTYTLDGSRNVTPAVNAANYGLFDGNVTPTQSFETGGSTRAQSTSSPWIRRPARSSEHSHSRPPRRLDQPARSISLRDRSEFGTDLLGPFFSKERPRCHPERSARHARVARDLLFDQNRTYLAQP